MQGPSVYSLKTLTENEVNRLDAMRLEGFLLCYGAGGSRREPCSGRVLYEATHSYKAKRNQRTVRRQLCETHAREFAFKRGLDFVLPAFIAPPDAQAGAQAHEPVKGKGKPHAQES